MCVHRLTSTGHSGQSLDMPKKVAPEDRRVPLNCLVAPATRKRIEELSVNGRSQGEVVDAAVIHEPQQVSQFPVFHKFEMPPMPGFRCARADCGLRASDPVHFAPDIREAMRRLRREASENADAMDGPCDFDTLVLEYESSLITAALQAAGGRLVAASKLLGMEGHQKLDWILKSRHAALAPLRVRERHKSIIKPEFPANQDRQGGK